METPNRLWLSSVKYLEDKRAVLVCFSRLDLRRTTLLPFFPSFFVSRKAMGREALRKALSPSGKRFKLSEKSSTFQVTASTFTALNALADSLFQETGFRAIIPGPERQFLLEQGWTYFDCFHFFPKDEFIRTGSSSLPEIKTQFFSEPLGETLNQLLSFDQDAALKLLESIALSSVLRLPIEALLPHKSARAEALFENTFWRVGRSRNVPAKAAERVQRPLPSFAGATLVDFSRLWSTILTKPFYNIGFSTIDCACCAPSSLKERNILPNTLLLAQFLQDGFYFDSCFPEFAQRFHEAHSAKESRLRRMREFFLPTVPVGPFNRGERAAIPMEDALQLAASSKAKILSLHTAHWFCLKRESRISELVVRLQKRVSALEREIAAHETAFFKKHSLAATYLLQSDAGFLLKKAKAGALAQLLSEIPLHLTNRESAFFSKKTADAVNSIESLLLGKFKSFAQEERSRAVLLKQGAAMLKSERPMSLLKRFAQREKIPAVIRPRIGKNRS